MGQSAAVKYWEIIADNLTKVGWRWDCVSAADSNERTIWIAEAHRGDVRADCEADGFPLTGYGLPWALLMPAYRIRRRF
jgi:hypothetical protein